VGQPLTRFRGVLTGVPSFGDAPLSNPSYSGTGQTLVKEADGDA
jgi:hypothetical protein